MKTIGMIGGMSWESTATYYNIINTSIKKALGGFHSAKCLLYSVDFAEIEECQTSGDWEKSAELLLHAAKALERGGADFFIICTNTMHKVAPQIEDKLSIPLLHIADVTAAALKAAGFKTAALLGTKYTMEEPFYKDRLQAAGLSVVIPDEPDRIEINRVIYNELCLGLVQDSSRRRLAAIIESLIAKGAEAVILGCTEIGLLLKEGDVSLPLFDTTVLHASAAALASLKE